MTRLQSVELVASQGMASIVSAEGARRVPVREVTGFEQLATALRLRLPEDVAVHTSPRLRAPSGAALVVCRPDVLEKLISGRGDEPDPIASRVVVVDVLRAEALHRAEHLGLAATIATGRYLRWQMRPSEETGSGVYGRKDVAQRIGATWSDLPQLQSERYALLTHAGLPDLVALLAAYAEAYAELHL